MFTFNDFLRIKAKLDRDIDPGTCYRNTAVCSFFVSVAEAASSIDFNFLSSNLFLLTKEAPAFAEGIELSKTVYCVLTK